jgi:glutamate 5-kinase
MHVASISFIWITLLEQALPHWRRAVLKVGSNLLAADGDGLTPRFAKALAAFIAASHAEGRQVVLVSSGAVAAGRAMLRECTAAGSALAARQALAALGPDTDDCVVAIPVQSAGGAGTADPR